jgi:hypothetical protein
MVQLIAERENNGNIEMYGVSYRKHRHRLKSCRRLAAAYGVSKWRYQREESVSRNGVNEITMSMAKYRKLKAVAAASMAIMVKRQ